MHDLDSENRQPFKVIDSLHNDAVDKCVDIILRKDGTFVYKEYRKDFEDQGSWYVNGPEVGPFADRDAAVSAARRSVEWLKPLT